MRPCRPFSGRSSTPWTGHARDSGVDDRPLKGRQGLIAVEDVRRLHPSTHAKTSSTTASHHLNEAHGQVSAVDAEPAGERRSWSVSTARTRRPRWARTVATSTAGLADTALLLGDDVVHGSPLRCAGTSYVADDAAC
jgi:hypothetical protein